MLNNLTADRIDTLEPQRQSNGILRIANLLNGDVFELGIQGFPLPKRAVGVIEIRYLNEVRKFAGNPTYDDITVTFNDYIDNDLAGVIDEWFTLVHNAKNGKTGWARTYKKTGHVELYGPNGQYSRFWDVRGVWPSSFDPGDIDVTSEDAVKIQGTFSIDKALRSTTEKSTDFGTA